MDPNYYRFYECNLDCYKLKAEKEFRCPKCILGAVEAQSLSTGSLTLSPSSVKTYNGFFPLGTTHTFTSTQLPPLANRECNGEMTLYLNNDLYVNVTLSVIVKSSGTILQVLVYQRVGNYTSVEMAISGNSVVLTCSPAATVRWIYRGI